jgi:hypothetical protein
LVVDSGAFICRSFIGKVLAMIVATFAVPVFLSARDNFQIEFFLKTNFFGLRPGRLTPGPSRRRPASN